MTVDALSEARVERAKQEAEATRKMLQTWAQKQAARILGRMELERNQVTLSLHWPKIKQGWAGGFVSGVNAGFQLGFQSVNKLTEKFLDQSTAIAQGVEKEPIQDPRLVELRTLVGEAIGEASMCWSETPTGVFESEKAEAIVNRILQHVAGLLEPKPLPPEVQAEANGQERLPNL